ncbi:MAG TPA: 4-hydroxy-3-methylbut-2-enyl diphosphate reductase [Acidimicrobiales bacterium]|jgi:4-hydroxy-3-methylbut-2-enyl diphosphate reductase|nr:4-hydroxy-3-methylbut-2-enyl diphosphate reductase [Acidimicrobiales bacterium]
MNDVIVLVPGRVEANFMGAGTVVTGTGAASVADAVARVLPSLDPGAAVAVVGTSGRLSTELTPGQLVVASEVWAVGDDNGDGGGGHGGVPAEGAVSPRLVRRLPSAALLAAELQRLGHVVSIGPVASLPDGAGPDPHRNGNGNGNGNSGVAPPQGDRRSLSALAALGALVVDHDSAWAATLAGIDRPLAVVRAVEDLPGPGAMAALDTRRAAASLAGIREPLELWAGACRSRRVLLASPRSFCAGVERAIEIVERALERYGAPVYVRRQIVHNTHVVGRLAAMGAVFVEELDEVPDGATVVLAAHGVSPDVRSEASARDGFTVIDATCPLVAKVHHEARRYAARGFDIVLVGHDDHEEVVGTYGEAPDRTHVVASPQEVDALEVESGAPVAYLTQTTLATDETAEVIAALRRRFPDVVGPSADDICYATQNRQDAVRAIARDCDLMLVVGSANSSNTARLVEVAQREGCRAELVEDAGQLRLSWLHGASTVGVTAGASAPESLVTEVVQALSALGPIEVDERRTTQETVRFALPQQVR